MPTLFACFSNRLLRVFFLLIFTNLYALGKLAHRLRIYSDKAELFTLKVNIDNVFFFQKVEIS